MSDERRIREPIEDAVSQVATSVEEVHQRIAAMPLTVLERLGIFERTARDVKQIQETSIGAVYDLVRGVNHQVAGLARDLLESREPGDAGKP